MSQPQHVLWRGWARTASASSSAQARSFARLEHWSRLRLQQVHRPSSMKSLTCSRVASEDASIPAPAFTIRRSSERLKCFVASVSLSCDSICVVVKSGWLRRRAAMLREASLLSGTPSRRSQDSAFNASTTSFVWARFQFTTPFCLRNSSMLAETLTVNCWFRAAARFCSARRNVTK